MLGESARIGVTEVAAVAGKDRLHALERIGGEVRLPVSRESCLDLLQGRFGVCHDARAWPVAASVTVPEIEPVVAATAGAPADTVEVP